MTETDAKLTLVGDLSQDSSSVADETSARAHGLEEYILKGPTGRLPRKQHVERALGAVGLGYKVEETYVVGREKIREFSKAVQANHPMHHDLDYAREKGADDLLAPPSFVAILGILAQRRLTEGFVVGYDMSQIMQTEQKIEYHEPIFAGDELTVDVVFDSFRQMAGTDIIVTSNIVYNQHGKKVITCWTTVVAKVVEEENKQIENAIKGVMMSE